MSETPLSYSCEISPSFVSKSRTTVGLVSDECLIYTEQSPGIAHKKTLQDFLKGFCFLTKKLKLLKLQKVDLTTGCF